jgi:hypothetical protein
MALSTSQVDAAAMVAEDRLTNDQIGAAIGVTRKTIERWKSDAEFAARVAEIVEAARAEALRCGVAVKAERIRGYQDRYQRMRALLDARAAMGQRLVAATQGDSDADRYLRSLFGKGELPPGLETGLLVKTVKVVGKVTEEEWSVDTGLLSEMRACEKQAAQEMGDWTERQEHTGARGGPIVVSRGPDLSGLSVEELEALERTATRLALPAGAAGGDTGGEGPPEPA